MSVTSGRPQPVAFPSESTTSLNFAVPAYLGWFHANPGAAATWTLPLLTSITEGANLWIRNISAYAITLNAFAGNTVGLASSLVIPANTIAWLVTDRSSDWKVYSLTPLGGSVVAGPSTFVQQATNNTTAVTVNTNACVVRSAATYTTAASNLASTFQVNNSKVVSTSCILAQVVRYTGTYVTNGVPQVVISSVATGSYQVQVYNTHPANALNGAVDIALLVV